MPEISVIIPAYNCTHTIRETLQSVLQQTFTDFEIIIINDGSTDNLVSVLSEFHDPRIRIFHYENGGLSIARNRGIDQATGPYLIFLDADDLWTPDKLESHFNLLEAHPEAAVAYSWMYFLDDETKECITNVPTVRNGSVFMDLLKENFIANGSNAFIRRSAIEQVGYFYQEFAGASDWDYWLRLAQNHEFILSPQRQVFYRQVKSSMSSNVEYMKTCMLTVIDKHVRSLDSHQKLIRSKAWSGIYVYCAKLSCERIQKDCKYSDFFAYLFQGFQHDPNIVFNFNIYLMVWRFLLVKLMPNSIYKYVRLRYRIIKNRRANQKALMLSDIY
jgi:glycosyltransferase involved in cell wall biosynthesis